MLGRCRGVRRGGQLGAHGSPRKLSGWWSLAARLVCWSGCAPPHGPRWSGYSLLATDRRGWLMVARCSVSATDRLDATRRDASGTSPQAATVGHLRIAAQVAPMAHRAPAAAHQQTETEPDRLAASGTNTSRQHRNRHLGGDQP